MADSTKRLVRENPPPEPARDTAPYAIRLRVWPAEYTAMVEAAKRAGVPVKEWALRVLVGAAR
jgi:hypothetical protein